MFWSIQAPNNSCIFTGVATEVECKLYVRSLGSINPDTMVSKCMMVHSFWQVCRIIIFWRSIGKNNNTRTVQAESSKFASVLFDQGFQIWVGWNWLERHLSVFCIDPIVPGFVVSIKICFWNFLTFMIRSFYEHKPNKHIWHDIYSTAENDEGIDFIVRILLLIREESEIF